jgi:nitrogen fixation protein NifU and related proteins
MDIYQEELMDIYKNPHNKGRLTKPTITVNKNNPICGDELILDLSMEKGVIKDARFDGSACSVSVISSSVMTDYLINKTIAQVKKLTQKDLLEMLKLKLSTSRVNCALLIFNALQEAIKKYEEEK